MKILPPIKITRLLIVLLFGISLLIIVLGFFRSPPPPPPTPESISPLSIPPVINNQNLPSIQNQVEPEPILPSSSYIYQVQSATDPQFAASLFGLTETNLVASRSTADRLMWFRQDQDQLTISLLPTFYIYYQKNINPSPSPITNDVNQFVATATHTIETYLQPLSSLPIDIGKIEYLRADASNYRIAANIHDATSIKFYLQAELDNSQLLTNTRPPGVGTITLNFDGSLNNFTFTPPPQVLSQQPTTPLQEIDAINMISAGKGTLIFAQTNKLTELDFVPDLASIALTDQEYIYLYQPEQKRIIPAYLLYGQAPDRTTRSLYKIIYIVPAI